MNTKQQQESEEKLAQYFIESSEVTQKYLESGDLAKDIITLEKKFALTAEESGNIQEAVIGYLLGMIGFEAAEDNVTVALRSRSPEQIKEILHYINITLYIYK